jgi:hypothetical protein
MIDDNPHLGRLKQREHLGQLVGLDLKIDEHVQVSQLGQQLGGIGVILRSQQGRVEGDAAYPQGAQPFELTAGHVVVDDRHAPQPAFSAGQHVDQAAVVVVIAGVRLDDERPLHAVSVKDRGQL